MKAKYFKNEKDFYNQFPKAKQEAIKAYWADKSSAQLKDAEKGCLHLEYKSEVEIASYDAEMAASLLNVAASFLEDRKPMPYHLADYIATAFREAANAAENGNKTTGEAQRDTLGLMLNLTALRCRPKTTPKIVGNNIFRLMTQEAQKLNILSETAALKQVASELGISLTTAKDHWFKWQSENEGTYRQLLKILVRWKETTK